MYWLQTRRQKEESGRLGSWVIMLIIFRFREVRGALEKLKLLGYYSAVMGNPLSSKDALQLSTVLHTYSL